MLLETLRARRNERAQLARGGYEPAGDVFFIMRLAYPAAFALMLLEGPLRTIGGVGPFGGVGGLDRAATSGVLAALGLLRPGSAPFGVFVAGAGVFALGKALKWWAILTLGPAWTFRVIVVPGAPFVTSGPYRFLRHPNYLGVVGELLGVALMTAAVVSGIIAVLGFGLLMRRRIAVEERALSAGGPTAGNRV
jgi:methyltransferase